MKANRIFDGLAAVVVFTAGVALFVCGTLAVSFAFAEGFAVLDTRADAAAPAPAARALAPAAKMEVATCGVWTATLATEDGPRDGFVVIDEAMVAALVADWERRGRPPVAVRLAGSTNEAGVAVALAATNRALVASVRLDRTGAAAFMGGRTALDAKFECARLTMHGPRGQTRPAIAPVRLAWLELTEPARARFHRED